MRLPGQWAPGETRLFWNLKKGDRFEKLQFLKIGQRTSRSVVVILQPVWREWKLRPLGRKLQKRQDISRIWKIMIFENWAKNIWKYFPLFFHQFKVNGRGDFLESEKRDQFEKLSFIWNLVKEYPETVLGILPPVWNGSFWLHGRKAPEEKRPCQNLIKRKIWKI